MATEAKIVPEAETRREKLDAYYVEKSVRNGEMTDYLIVSFAFCIALAFLGLGAMFWMKEGFIYGLFSIPFFFSGLFLIRSVVLAVRRLP